MASGAPPLSAAREGPVHSRICLFNLPSLAANSKSISNGHGNGSVLKDELIIRLILYPPGYRRVSNIPGGVTRVLTR